MKEKKNEYYILHAEDNEDDSLLTELAFKELGLTVSDIEFSQEFQEHVLSAFHATMLTLNTAAVKIICNQNGNAFVKQMPVQIIRQPKPQ